MLFPEITNGRLHPHFIDTKSMSSLSFHYDVEWDKYLQEDDNIPPLT